MKFSYIFSILLIILLSSFVFGSSKDVIISDNDFNISTKEIIECNRPVCLINVELCKKNDLKLSKNDLSLYFDNDGKKDIILKVKSKNDKISCEQLSFSIRVPLFSVIKFGLLYESLDLDPFINSTSYEANFTEDVNSSSDVTITDNNISALFTDFGFGLIGSFSNENISFLNEVTGVTSSVTNGDNDNTDGINNFYGLFADDNDVILTDNYFNNLVEDAPFTAMCWVYWEADGGTQFILGAGKDATNYGGWAIEPDGTLKTHFKFNNDWGGNNVGSLKLEPDSWNMVTITKTDNELYFYVNGTNETPTNPTLDTDHFTTHVNWARNSIGTGCSGSACNADPSAFTGRIDECMMYNRTLYNSDIEAIYNDGIGKFRPFTSFTGLYVSDSFIVNSTISNITPVFNGEDITINISLDNGSSFFNNITSGVSIELSNSSVLIYRIGFLSVNAWFSDFNISLTVEIPTNINIGVLNVSNNTVDRGEDFLLFINYTNDQQELISDASCSGTFYHIYQELTSETGINQIVDASSEYSINFSGIEIDTTNEFDLIIFNVCRASGTNQDLNVNISGDISIITSSDVLLCTDGFNKISINSTQCIDKSSCNITFSKTGNQDYFIIDGFVEHDRFFREHTDTFINNLSEDLYIPHRHYEYYEQGVHEFNASCYKNLFQSQIETINIIALNVDPIVSLQSIDTVIEGFQDFNNNTLTTFANFSIGNITAFIFDLNLLFSNISIINASSGELIGSIVNNSVLDFSLRAGTFNISVIANDTFNRSDIDTGFIVVSPCSEDWERTDLCAFPDITSTIDYDDNNLCGTFGDLPANNGSSDNCTYVDIEGDISCLANEKPLIKVFQNIEWFCYLNNTGAKPTKCISYVSFNDNIIQTNPKPEYVQQIGLVDYFTAQPENSQYQTVSIYFDSKDLIHNEEVTFGIRCSSEVVYYNFEMNVTPQFKELSRSIGDRTIWLKDNSPFILLFIFGLVILVIILAFMVKRFKEVSG